MGHNKIRNLKTKETKWTDKSSPRHKHNFNIECLACVKRIGSGVDYYHVMRCEHCNSFVVIDDKEGSWKGDVSNTFGLQKLFFISTRKALNLDKNMRCIDAVEFMSNNIRG